jgi:2-polyprenyl-6-methoxyphenol hydroxylase-like FAD-dependent oxidoreductase
VSDFEAPVGIVGAGPVGLSCALRLATFGVSSVVLEADSTLVKQGSKACLIQGDVLDILDKFGCADQIAAEGITWDTARTYVRGKEIEKRVYPRPAGYGPFVNISQHRVQQVLLAHLTESLAAEVRWSHRVFDLCQDDDGVTVRVGTPDGISVMRFAYLVGCDGIRSEVRGLVGAEWLGYTHGDRFLITDIRAPLTQAHERHFHYDPPFNPGRQLVMHAQPDNLWRIDWQLPPDVNIVEERRTGALEQRIRAVIGDVPYEIDWLSTYRFFQRVVDRMQVDRVFLAGDAAHAFPPYGARGMNSGVQDVDNLAWKLALVLRERADPSLLDTYHPERHAAALENLRMTEATIRFIVPPNRAKRLIRNAVLRLSAPLTPLRRRVNSGKMAEPFTYADSPLVDATEPHPLLGALAPDFRVSVGGAETRLRRLLGESFVLLHFAVDVAGAARFVDAVETACGALDVRLAVVLPPGTDVAGVSLPRATVVRDEDSGHSATYGERPRCFLLRPDGHVMAARATMSPRELQELLSACVHAVARAPEPSRREIPLEQEIRAA